jgi:hypothetical protein
MSVRLVRGEAPARERREDDENSGPLRSSLEGWHTLPEQIDLYGDSLGNEYLRVIHQRSSQDGQAQLHGRRVLADESRNLHATLPQLERNPRARLMPTAALTEFHWAACIIVTVISRRKPILGHLLH